MKRKHRQDADASGDVHGSGEFMLPPLVVTDGEATTSAPAFHEVLNDALRLDVPALALATLVTPLPLGRLLTHCWGQRPAVVHRSDATHFSGLLSSADITALLKNKQLRYGVNVDLAAYDSESGRRTLNDAENVALHEDVVRHFAEGCSVRVLHPQRYQDSLLRLVQALERFFNTPVGCNAYWTPPACQGFAPHYDDIDALVLQLEGEKRWRLYAPRDAAESLPRYSSPNFDRKDLGAPLAEVVLKPGDTMYMPRGLIHEACSLPNTHSLHVTISMGQRTAWIDFLELVIPAALRSAAEEMPEFRASLPRRFLEVMGAVNSDQPAHGLRGEIIRWTRELMRRVCDAAPLDAAADQMGAAFQRTRAPPGTGTALPRRHTLTGADRVRVAFAGCARLCVEGDEAVVYHPFSNARAHLMAGQGGDGEHRDGSGAVLLFPLDSAHVVEALLHTGPEPCALDELAQECGAEEDQVLHAATRLARGGVLVVM